MPQPLPTNKAIQKEIEAQLSRIGYRWHCKDGMKPSNIKKKNTWKVMIRFAEGSSSVDVKGEVLLVPQPHPSLLLYSSLPLRPPPLRPSSMQEFLRKSAAALPRQPVTKLVPSQVSSIPPTGKGIDKPTTTPATPTPPAKPAPGQVPSTAPAGQDIDKPTTTPANSTPPAKPAPGHVFSAHTTDQAIDKRTTSPTNLTPSTETTFRTTPPTGNAIDKSATPQEKAIPSTKASISATLSASQRADQRNTSSVLVTGQFSPADIAFMKTLQESRELLQQGLPTSKRG
jgi:hypothetical protein